MTGKQSRNKGCRIDGCDRKHEARGLCNAHYLKDRRERLGRCQEEDCTNNAHSRGLCPYHYRKLRESDNPGSCAVEVCGRGASSAGLCSAHYSRKWYRENGPERNHYYELDDEVGVPQTYGGAHARVRAQRGDARDFRCIDCGAVAENWSFAHDRCTDPVVDDASGFPYSLDTSDYDPRCLPCHARFDKRGTCKRGHVLTDESSETTVVRPSGARQCRICRNALRRVNEDPADANQRRCDHPEDELYRRKSGPRKGQIVQCRACRRERVTS